MKTINKKNSLLMLAALLAGTMTFGAVGQTSAPGQIPVNDLHTVLHILHEAR